MSPIKQQLARRLAAARGAVESDLCLKNARMLDVYGCRFVDADLTVCDGVIVGVEPGLPAKQVIDLRGKAVVPGFIDAHVHVESSLLVPQSFQSVVLPRGTTTAVCDPHELANVMGAPGIEYFLQQAATLQLDLKVMLSSCVPATEFETNGGGVLDAAALRPLQAHSHALGLAEVMNVPAVIHGDDAMLDKLVAFDGTPRDGHCPLVTGRELSVYAAARITSCHESSELEEAREKLRKGLAVWIREGSVAKDLDALAPLLTLATSTSIGFCTDDRNPLDIEAEGHLDHLLRKAIALGVAPEVAYRAASWSVARHYELASARAFTPVGAIAPGYRADLVVLDDVVTCAIHAVYKSGVDVRALEFSKPSGSPPNTVRARVPEATDLLGPEGQVHVIGVRPGRILTDRHVLAHDAPGVLRLSVLERHGQGHKPANGYVTGFGEVRGAIASSVGHDSHNLIVLGSSTEDMRLALSALCEVGGGFVVVQDGQVLELLPLPFGGLMTHAEPAQVATKLRSLRSASRSIGCTAEEPFLQLAFLSLPVIPSLKLTDRGLMDVDAFQLIPVRAA